MTYINNIFLALALLILIFVLFVLVSVLLGKDQQVKDKIEELIDKITLS